MPLRRAFFHFSAHQRMGLAVWGLVLFTGITLLAWQAVRALWWTAPRSTTTDRTPMIATPPPSLQP